MVAKLYVIPGSHPCECAQAADGGQLAAGTGGALVALDDRENEDGAGNFSISAAIPTTAPPTRSPPHRSLCR